MGDDDRAERERRRYGARWTEGVYDAGWLGWLHERHSTDEMRKWARRLGMFRYCRATGGHGSDVDELWVALGHVDDVLAALGLAAAPEHGWVEVGRHQVHVSLRAQGDVLLRRVPEGADVTERDVRAAEDIERLLAPVAHHVIDPPRADPHCVCPRNYPELWA